MQQKYSLEHSSAVFRLAIMSVFLLSSLFSLTAQEEPRTPIGKPKIITGIGFETSFSFLSDSREEFVKERKELDGLSRSEIHLNLGGRIPFLVAFEIAKPYSLGFGAYVSFTYQMSKLGGSLDVNKIERSAEANKDGYFSKTPEEQTEALKGYLKDFPIIGRDGFLLYERGEVAFSPVFYNEFALNEKLSLSLALGPSFALTFGDRVTTGVEGPAAPPNPKGLNRDPVDAAKAFAYIRKESVQFSFGLLLDLGLQIRFNQSLGMGVSTFAKFYFTGQKAAVTLEDWTEGSAYLGNWGANVSLLLFH